MICLGCNRWSTRLAMPIYKEVSIEEIAVQAHKKHPIAHYIDTKLKIAKVPIGGICKKCVQKGVARQYAPKMGWREGLKRYLSRPKETKVS